MEMEIILPKMTKRRTLNMKEKIELIRDVESSPHRRKKDIAAEYGIPVNTLSTIYSNREKILDQCKNGYVNLNMKKIKKSIYPEVEEALLNWYIQNHSNPENGEINAIVLKEKALQFAESLGQKNFLASSGWIEKFKARHNICFKKNRKRSAQPPKPRPDFPLAYNFSNSNLVWENISNPVMELTEYESGACRNQNVSNPSVSGENNDSRKLQLAEMNVKDGDDVTRSDTNSSNTLNFFNQPHSNMEMYEEYITDKEAESAFNVLLHYVKLSNTESTKALEALSELKNFITNEKNARRQTKITDFFKTMKF